MRDAVAVLVIDLDHGAGVAVLRKRLWSQRVAVGDLVGWLGLYRRLWSRGSKIKNEPGPWARFYEQDVHALEAAVREAQNVR